MYLTFNNEMKFKNSFKSGIKFLQNLNSILKKILVFLIREKSGNTIAVIHKERAVK
jgi:hypothetical protein